MAVKRKAAQRRRTAATRAMEDAPGAQLAKVSLKSVRAGLAVGSVERLREELDVTQADIGRYLGVARQTLSRRKRAGRLSASESDRVVRYRKLLARSTDLVGDHAGAVAWLKSPAPALDGETPLERATTEFGAEHVFDLILRLEHGVPT